MEKFLVEYELPPDFRGQKKFYKHVKDGFVYTQHLGGPEFWTRFGNNFEARDSDVFITSYPRTGTTWTTEIVYLLTHDLDYESASKISSIKRSPYLLFSDSPDNVFDIPSPRCIRTHIPYAHLPQCILDKKCKVIYAIRNPEDSLVSFYNCAKTSKFLNYVGSFDATLEMFMEENYILGSPFWKHVLQYWEHRYEENFLMTIFEEKKKDLSGSIQKIANFLGKTLTDEQLKTLTEHCSLAAMKANPSVNLLDFSQDGITKSQFIRKGEVGDWRNYFSSEQNERMDKYVKEHFNGSGLEFTYEL